MLTASTVQYTKHNSTTAAEMAVSFKELQYACDSARLERQNYDPHKFRKPNPDPKCLSSSNANVSRLIRENLNLMQ